MNLVALDPGLLHPAIAFFLDGELRWAARVRISKDDRPDNIGERVRRVATLCYEAAMTPPRRGDVLNYNVHDFVYEWPQVYRAAKSKGDPNDLLPLAAIGAALSMMWHASVTSYTPAEWIGQLPKGTTGDPRESPRGTRIWSRLSDAERQTITLSHDAIDAVGIGLFHLGRLKPKRVLTSS